MVNTNNHLIKHILKGGKGLMVFGRKENTEWSQHYLADLVNIQYQLHLRLSYPVK